MYTCEKIIRMNKEKNCPFEHISIDTFEQLTGKKINWHKRESRKVFSVRIKGHIKLYDEKFIINETYKHKNALYVCHSIDNKNIALLNKVGNNMCIKSAKDPLKELWEIV